MTKPAAPPSAAGEVVEIDAMDGMEWEQGQRTPQASDANLAALVRETANAPEPAATDGPGNTSLKTRARAAGPASSQRARAGNAATKSAQRAGRSTSPNDPIERVAQVGRVGHVGPPGPAAAPGPGRPLSPAPASVARAGSPPLDRAPSSADPEAASPSFDDITLHNSLRGASPASSSGPPSLNDILRAPSRPRPPDSAVAQVPLPLPAPAESSRNPVPLVVRDPAAPPPSERRAASETGEKIGSASWRRLLLVIGGTAGCAVLAAVLVVGARGKSDEHPPGAPVEDPAHGPPVPAQSVASPLVAPVTPARPPAKPATAPARPVAAPEPAAAPEPPGRRVSLALAPDRTTSAAPSHQGQPGRRPARKPTGKKLVVDYSTRTSEAAMPGLVAQAAEDPAIGLARSAYLNGNQQLFAGDAQGAIRAYRESLSLYSGYVGGYRGLGLAYAQLGDNQNALEAFKMYVGTVPNAKDVALIKKRIARLQGK